jgi:spore coat protein A
MQRRQFLKIGAGASAAALLHRRAYGYAQSMSLQKFIQPLRGLGGSGIPVASANTTLYPGVDYYEIVMGEYTDQLHPNLPKATRLWGYADAQNRVFRHLGGVIVSAANRPVRVRQINQLPPAQPLPIDTSLMGADKGATANRAAVHLHGGFVPWPSDGGPHAWSAPDGTAGVSHVNWLPDYRGTLTDHSYYPNNQSARLMWYHDHALGTTRLNAYAGLASAYIIRDGFEQNLIETGAIPGLVPGTEIPLIIQDKVFKQVADQWGAPGDLWYPSVYEPDRWDVGPSSESIPLPSCVPEFFGDTMLVNGLVYPYAAVEQRKYRLRILNACNARFCRLTLCYAQGASFPDSTEPNTHRPGPGFLQIGTEGGFLPSSTGPVALQSILLAPAERADVIVDFSGVPAGSKLILCNDAAAPFPDGDTDNDFYPGSNKRATFPTPGYGPNTRTLLQFQIGARTGNPDPRPSAPLKLPDIRTLSGATRTRDLTLNEDFDGFGRLIQRLGTSVGLHSGTLARDFEDNPTETPSWGETEIWRIFNLTGDTHPIHFHLVNVQIVSRQRFDVKHYAGVPSFTGPPRLPDANETGWKETVRMNPGECTTVIMRFDKPVWPVSPTVVSPRTGGSEYVWHCHILEHEEHDMMRPLVVR